MVALGFSPEVFLALMVSLFSYCHFGNVKCSFGLLHILLNLSWLAVFIDCVACVVYMVSCRFLIPLFSAISILRFG